MEGKICLFVDDDLDDHEIFLEVLKGIDKTVVCIMADSAGKAIKILEMSHELPDFIFVDLNMPIMSGIQFLKEIKSRPDFDKIPVIIYTTSSFDRDINETQKLGASHFLVKPYSISSLTDVLSRLLSNQVKTFIVDESV